MIPTGRRSLLDVAVLGSIDDAGEYDYDEARADADDLPFLVGTVVDGIRWVLHTQAHWSDIPAAYAAWPKPRRRPSRRVGRRRGCCPLRLRAGKCPAPASRAA